MGNAGCGEEKQVQQRTDSAQTGDLARGGSRAKRYVLEDEMQTSHRHNIARIEARRMAWEHSVLGCLEGVEMAQMQRTIPISANEEPCSPPSLASNTANPPSLRAPPSPSATI
jgi:hypothetical protein